MLHIILYKPEIPQNTGNIGRLCALTTSRLHLIHPLGFELSDRHLKRSGMDYWKSLDLINHNSWERFLAEPNKPRRIWLFTTKSTQSFWDVGFEEEDGLLFGNEGSGCPSEVHEQVGKEWRVTIPMFGQGLRSLNLSTSVGIGLYEALRQIK
ncbi:MAG: tRNA (cytidine(34)-2'-O)-methyltransferase [Candidatus Moanabacter tarae]|uniref:Putative tRNA (cytidine(34)-2'-O)-methyltransferase n=1 Tax=Candidatus Moanibacter tarae TaxID=2200854 RepID=A0A2Z4ACE0_9BACT|nr:MAG: tRNA (cytidine(34)-2'-O)-methyltransferase [Candidatus Moanabacter tarae]|tara:strand:+ start:11723 stop:12178 length:456 start_codon:yes stop_codon:yes gene_type:complete